MKRYLVCLFVLVIFLLGCEDPSALDGTQIVLSDGAITVNGAEISSDPSRAVYSAKDIVFYLEGQGIAYGEGEKKDEHSQAEADAHTVVHITKPGRYVLSGKLSLGQIAVDLGKDAETDPEAVVSLVLNGVDITCTVAPAVIFYNVYECGIADKDAGTKDVDTSKAGANVILADGSVNNVNGSYVAKIYKSCELNEDGTKVKESKKLHKYDGAFYSKRSMNISGDVKGDGVLNLKAENEGLGTELHLTINSGVLNIVSGNDGINTNEDGVSVTTIWGGTVNIRCDGSTGEGDGIDSNGWLVINGGTVTAQACATSADAGIDSDQGIYLNGGKLMATGNMLDRIAGGKATYAVFQFASRQEGGQNYFLNGNSQSFSFCPENAFTYLIVSQEELSPGDYTLWQGETQLGTTAAMQGGPQGRPNAAPSPGMTPPEGQKPPQGLQPPLGTRPPMPEGQSPEEQPPHPPAEGMPPDGMPGGASGELSFVFVIQNGANTFGGVRAA